MSKPIIGVTCPWSTETWGDPVEINTYYYVERPYVKAVAKHGGIPILLAPEYDEESLDYYLDSILNTVDGILFSGGGDVKGQSSAGRLTLREQQPVRYDFEAALMKKAYERRLPILGICRGFQMMLEVFGGSLSDETIENHKQNIPSTEPWHLVEVNKDSKLYEIIGNEVWNVNSFHVQKAEKIPEGFIVSATSKDGVVEAIELKNYPFLVGFQFHPEALYLKDKASSKVFEWFIQEVKAVK